MLAPTATPTKLGRQPGERRVDRRPDGTGLSQGCALTSIQPGGSLAGKESIDAINTRSLSV
jgi:hypothetical protein